MSEIKLLPPEIEAHPRLEFQCPHCHIELTLSMAEHWRCVTAESYTTLATPRQRTDELEYTRVYARCPACSQPFQLGVEREFAYRAKAMKFGPNARMIQGSNRITDPDWYEPPRPTPNLKLG